MKKLMKSPPVKKKHINKQPMRQPCVMKAPKVGRPRTFKKVEDFNTAVEAYLYECYDKNQAPLLMGLILYIGLSSRESLDRYGRIPEFSDSVKRAKAYIELSYEMCLRGTTPTGAIFALKNFGWTDGKTVNKDERLLKTQKLEDGPEEFRDMSELEIANWMIARMMPALIDQGLIEKPPDG